MQIVQILNRLEEKDDELLFYEHMQTVAEAAMSEELSSDTSRPAQALREVLDGLAKAACTWASESMGTGMEGSGFEMEDQENSMNCSNTTDIVRYAREKELDFIFTKMHGMRISTDTLSLALRLRPIYNKTRFYLRDQRPDVQPDTRHKKAWVTQNISPANRCYVCRAAS